jgi:DNA/RNA-binding domain of Phe-tRNA-synthetase-like protein
MVNIKISKEIKTLTPNFCMAVLEANVEVKYNANLKEYIGQISSDIDEKYDISDIINIPKIKEGRNAYKVYGKDPSRYRLAVESLYRRLSKGNPLYLINDVVDMGNVISILTMKSTAMLDKDNIHGEITIRLGKDDDDFIGIGRGKLNITNIPVYVDSKGPFGSTTSDTERTMITSQTKSLLMFIISFSGQEQLITDIQLTKSLFDKYITYSNLEFKVVN